MKLNEVTTGFEMRLDHMIQGVLHKYAGHLPKGGTLEKVRKLVLRDYADSDITKVTPRDIVEIIDASAQHVNGEDVLV